MQLRPCYSETLSERQGEGLFLLAPTLSHTSECRAEGTANSSGGRGACLPPDTSPRPSGRRLSPSNVLSGSSSWRHLRVCPSCGAGGEQRTLSTAAPRRAPPPPGPDGGGGVRLTPCFLQVLREDEACLPDAFCGRWICQPRLRPGTTQGAEARVAP